MTAEEYLPGKTGKCACVLDRHLKLPKDLVSRSEISEILNEYGIYSEVTIGERHITWRDDTMEALTATCGA